MLGKLIYDGQIKHVLGFFVLFGFFQAARQKCTLRMGIAQLTVQE